VRALQWRCPVLILDEATSSLDPAMRDAVMAVLREEAAAGTTVLLVTHDVALVEGVPELGLA